MDATLDRLSMIVGRPAPRPLNLVINSVWWVVVILGVTSLWPPAYRGLEGLVRLNGLDLALPSPWVVVPLAVALTGLMFAHTKAIERRIRLTGD